MEATLMANAVALDASPANVLRLLRGSIVDARVAYPDVLHVEVHDSGGGRWRLATQDAEWTPSDPSDLPGRSIEGAGIEEATGELRLDLSDGSQLRVIPGPREASDDPPTTQT